MKKTFLMLFLGLGLITLAACTGNREPVEPNVVPDLEGEVSEEVLMDGRYEVNSEASVLTWHGARVIASDHTGLVDIKSGNLEIVDGALVGGEFVMDLTTITSDEGIDRLVTHLKSEDFFDVENHPEARLVINNVTPGLGFGSYLVEADLTIKDITAPITFNTDLVQDNNSIIANAAFTIDRTVWDIRYDSGKFFQDLGDKAIKDDISFGVNLIADLE